MAGVLKKVQRGEPLVIPASTYNSFVDATLDYQQRRLDQGGAGQPSPRDSDLVLVKNTSGADRARFEILGIDAPVILPADNLDEFVNHPTLSGVIPTAADHQGRFVVLAEPIRWGELGLAWLSGVCPVKIDVADVDHAHADVTDDTAANLKSGGDGAAQILWKASGTGIKWALVRLGRWSPATGAVFPVNLTRDGGSQGTSTTQATWTYTVIDPVTSQTLATGVNPTVSPHQWQRPLVGYMKEATFGYAHYDAQGGLVLGWINEVAEQEPCVV